MCKIIYFLLLPAGLCSISEAALRSRPPRPRVALEWKGQTGRHQRRGASSDAVSNVTDLAAAADLRRQMVEWRDNVAKYQDKWTVRRNRCRGGDSCCSEAAPCGLGGGDCDGDSECEVGLRCGRDNCRDRRKFWGARGSFSESDDCCERRQPCLGSNRCCRPGRPCILGEGDCDSDGDCALNLVCGDHSACAAGIGGVDDFETGADCCAIDCRDIQHIPQSEREKIPCYLSREREKEP